MAALKIAIVQDSLDPARGGAETSTHEMAVALAGRGHEVAVVCRGAAERSGPADAVRPYRIIAVPPRGVGKDAQITAFLVDCPVFAAFQNFDIVHAVTPCFRAHVYQPRGGLFPAAIEGSLAVTRSGLLRGIKRFVRLFHLKQRTLRHAERAMLRGPDVVIAPVSRAAGDEVRRCYPQFPGQRVRPVFNAVTLGPLTGDSWRDARSVWRSKAGLRPDDRLLVFVAHNFALKGLRELLEACDRLGDAPGWQLLVAGRDQPRRYLRALRRSRIGGRVAFLEAARDIPALFAAADALIHPTWYDPCSRVVLEALVCGLPCLTTRLNGAAEAVRGTQDGIVIDHPSDADALLHGLRALLDRPLRTAPPTELRPELHMNRHAADLEALYMDVLAQRQARG